MTKDVEELSASGVKSYVECPKQFYLNYLTDVPEPTDGEPEHFRVGNAVHGVIEDVLMEDEWQVGSDEETDTQPAERLFELFMERVEESDHEYSDDEKVETCFETASRWITSFVENVNHVEEEWGMERDGIRYRGFADLVADIGMDELYENTIVDWKTGQESDEWKERIQGGMYAEMHHEIYDEYPDAIVFVYLNEETQSMHKRVQDGKVFWNEQENKYWTEIEKYKNQILRSETLGSWEAKPGQSKCYFCPYKYHCADSGVGAENVTPNQIEIGKL
jgi:CRISPR/Cas system-associated exonuclease Cas4 (RecB family)